MSARIILLFPNTVPRAAIRASLAREDVARPVAALAGRATTNSAITAASGVPAALGRSPSKVQEHTVLRRSRTSSVSPGLVPPPYQGRGAPDRYHRVKREIIEGLTTVAGLLLFSFIAVFFLALA